MDLILHKEMETHNLPRLARRTFYECWSHTHYIETYEGVSKSFRTESTTKYTLTTI